MISIPIEVIEMIMPLCYKSYQAIRLTTKEWYSKLKTWEKLYDIRYDYISFLVNPIRHGYIINFNALSNYNYCYREGKLFGLEIEVNYFQKNYIHWVEDNKRMYTLQVSNKPTCGINNLIFNINDVDVWEKMYYKINYWFPELLKDFNKRYFY